MSVYESSITNPKKQLEFYKDLSEQLQVENKQLKKQLENKYEKVGTLTSELLYEENTKLINQQKEFIKYLENEIYSFELRGTSPEYNFENVLKRILLKYKETIGGDR